MTETARTILEQTADRLEAEAAAIRAQLAAMDGAVEAEPVPVEDGPSTFDHHDLLEVSAAASRFNQAEDTIRSWLRRDPLLGVKVGGRWRVSIKRMRVRTGHR